MGWQTHPHLCFCLYKTLGELHITVGDLDMAEILCNNLLKLRALNIADKIEVLILLNRRFAVEVAYLSSSALFHSSVLWYYYLLIYIIA